MNREFQNFKVSNAFGKNGEGLVRKALGASKSLDFTHDMILQGGQRLELKTDGRENLKLFLETSSCPKGTVIDGGPFRSAKHGIPLFGYFWEKTGLLVIFETLPLVKWINDNKDHLEMKRGPGSVGDDGTKWPGNWGYLVELRDVAHLADRFYFISQTGNLLDVPCLWSL